MSLLRNRTVQVLLVLNAIFFVILAVQSFINTRRREEALYKRHASFRRFFRDESGMVREDDFRRYIRMADRASRTRTIPDGDLAWSAQQILATFATDDRASLRRRDTIQSSWMSIERPTPRQAEIMLTVPHAVIARHRSGARVTATDKILALSTLAQVHRDPDPAFTTEMLRDTDPDVRWMAGRVRELAGKGRP
jgi:hypothetical protein